jgi:hypothetical protein
MIIDHIRNLEEFKNLYETRPMNDNLYTFEHIVNNPNLFCFYDENDGKLLAFLFLNEDKDGNLYMSGASVPKNMSDNINGILKICNAVDRDMYAETDKKPAIVLLKKCGFKEIKKNIYVRYKNGKK